MLNRIPYHDNIPNCQSIPRGQIVETLSKGVHPPISSFACRPFVTNEMFMLRMKQLELHKMLVEKTAQEKLEAAEEKIAELESDLWSATDERAFVQLELNGLREKFLDFLKEAQDFSEEAKQLKSVQTLITEAKRLQDSLIKGQI